MLLYWETETRLGLDSAECALIPEPRPLLRPLEARAGASSDPDSWLTGSDPRRLT